MDLSDEDKELIAVKYINKKDDINLLKKRLKLFLIIGSVEVVIGTVVLSIFTGILMLPFLLFEFLPLLVTYIINSQINEIMKNCLDGKISLKEFKILLKDPKFKKILKIVDFEKNNVIDLKKPPYKTYDDKKEYLIKDLKESKISFIPEKTKNKTKNYDDEFTL